MNVDSSILMAYAVTPCHAGSGSSLGVVDNPIQRERHTNWPVVVSSGVKGAIRAHYDKFKGNSIAIDTETVFGTDRGTGNPGIVTVSDLKILAFPMRSSCSPFVWITCPAVLKRFTKDLKLTGMKIPFSLPDQKGDAAVCWAGSITGQVLLEDWEVVVSESKEGLSPELQGYLKNCERLLVVSNEVFDYGVSNCTSILAQIKIDQEKGTTAAGSLRYQEELPSDTLMYSVIFWGDSRTDEMYGKVKEIVTKEVMQDFIQIGGDETCGRGIFEIEWK